MDKSDYASVEVSKDKLLVLVNRDEKTLREKVFPNTRSGHRAIGRHLGSRPTRVIMEATGVYYLDLAIFLTTQEGVEVMILNPQVSRHYAIATLKRAKNDSVDAKVLLDYVMTRPFVPFNPPSEVAYKLRAISRKIRSIIGNCARTRSQLHAEQSTVETPKAVIKASERSIRNDEKTIKMLMEEALKLVAGDPGLKREFEIVDSVPGFADGGTVQVLGELKTLPAHLSTRQVVAFAGLDPVEHKSGSSVDKKKGISKRGSKYLRIALFMAALTAVRYNPHVKAFHEHLIAKGKAPIVALIAVCRKLLHSIWGMLKNNETFDGNKFYRLPKQEPSSVVSAS